MPHDTPLIATIVAGLGLAFIFGALANRFKVPPLVGYLIAGVLVGPNTPGFVADQELALELAEIGVILLMFGVGLHFSLKDLLSVHAIAVPGAIVQIAFATALGAGLAWMLGWSLGAGLVFGLALSVASTVVLLRALQERRMIETERGRIAVGWLIVEDLAMVLALVLLPALAGVLGGEAQTTETPNILALRFDFGVWGVIGLTLAKVAAFVVVMMVVGRRVIPWVLHYVAHTGSRELFRLSVLAIALGVAFGAAKLFGVSLALGAFFAGMIMSESELSHQAAEETLPLRDAFSVLFFVSVGMLFDPTSLLSNTWPILATLFIIIIGKSVAAFLIVIAFGYPVATALIISASLAQIGEFSFILAELGVGLGLLPEKGRDLILAGAILSIVLNPVVFAGVARLKPWLEKRSGKVPETVEAVPIGPATEPGEVATTTPVASAKVDDDTPPPTKLTDHTILIGYGRVGSLVGQSLKDAGLPFLVIEDSDKTIAKLMADGVETVAGNAVKGEVFGAANAAGARRLILAIPNAFEAGQIVLKAKAANPGMLIIARAHSDAEVEHLTGLGADKVIMGEREIARGIVEQVLEGSGKPPANDPEPDAPPAAA
ncbi:YbaL family putative K(+) efflux transporter [Aminobacter aminovorans]|uniref:CPA2 family monovalent cation:H+ antiporter-2 n=1 Tax=Aminobacter aminovorans TaxID=83263 RepID=A0AAC8YJC1_AMIAI|nr:YbaL family putative K(+) efflux transporter [Aminobacter aminovorans]AMS39213.1 sodium:proton antiporter [Aminobacter aminovorans]MBB3707046.1 CPA2 family monovalent cation:H+ antiporter-2 [Aminobacter aminovorans]